jgi:sRNA-binding protein
MYKCVDEHGVTNYSDKPCVGAKGGKVDIQGQPPLSGQLRSPNENLSSQDAEFKRRQIERDRQAEKDDKDRAAAQRRCTALRNEQVRLSNARRVIVLDGKGGKSYMDDQSRDKRLAQLNDQLSRCP